jgi:hypothetical protein
MRSTQLLRPLVLALCLAANYSHAQPWAGIIDPSRAVDWTTAGIPGGIPSRTTQCGATIAPYSGSSSTINSAIAACPAGQYVSLGAGTFNLSSGISFGGHNNVTLRGQGANSTFLVFSGAGAGSYNSVVAMESSGLNENDSPQNVCDWTAGYSRGSTVITLANCGSTTPAKGSLSNIKVGSILILDQLDEASDTGTIWNCLAGVSEGGTQCANNPTGNGGEARNNGTCNGSLCARSQQQGVIVTGISGSNITISPGLYMPNWRSGQKPQVWFASNPAIGMGLENISIDATSSGSGQTVMLANCDQCYVKGIRSIEANRSHVRLLTSTRFQIQDSYTYENISHNTVSYGMEMMGGWNGIIANNIMQQNTDSEPSCSGACAGNVVAYNFNIDNVYNSSGWMQAGFYQHASGDVYNLWEGNIGPGYNADDVHGTHHFETIFRNYLIGNQTAGCGSAGVNTCTAQTVPVQIYAGSRYFNIIGNVLGQAGFHNNYTCSAASSAACSSGTTSIYVMGYTGNSGQVASAVNGFCSNPSCSATGAFDPQVATYLMRWGNYDTVSGAVRWTASEVPSSLSSYANPVPSSQTLPASMYLAAKPSWFGSVPWPAIGPDVSGGTVSGMAGHANKNPAMLCYLNVMSGATNGTGAVLPFDASSCYGSSGGSGGSGTQPAAPTNVSAVVQ